MTEQEQKFWEELRFSITRSKKIEDSYYAYCDWIEPKTYYLDIPETIIEGKIGVLMSDLMEFKFSLIIAKKYQNLNEIEWENLIPNEENARWLFFNGEVIEIEIIEKT